jgi:hypothetical protein
VTSLLAQSVDSCKGLAIDIMILQNSVYPKKVEQDF